MESYVVRMWLPDRPGALGQVASRIGAVRGEIVGIEILERGAGRAIDELVVDLPERVARSTSSCRRSSRSTASTSRRSGRWPTALHDPRLDALETAAILVGATDRDELLQAVVEHARRAVGAEWSAVVAARRRRGAGRRGPGAVAGLAGRLRRGQPVLGPGGRRARPVPTTSCGRRCRRPAWPWWSAATAPPTGPGSDGRSPRWPASSTPACGRSSATPPAVTTRPSAR